MKHLTLISGLGAILAFALMAFRILSVVNYDHPLQLITMTAEWESLFAIWKVINGQELYTDRLKIPFNAVIYNWLFYQSYAAFTGGILSFLKLGDEWLPTVARHLSLIGAATGFVAAYTVFLRLFETKTLWTKAFCLAFAAYIITGPLIGWWAFTARSDIWALTLEIIAVACFLKYYPSQRIHTVLLLAVFCYLAWSFKQINVYAVGGAGLFLLLRRDWTALAILVGAMVMLWGTTLIVGGDLYIENTLFTDFAIVLSISHGLFKLSQGAFNTFPILVMGGALICAAAFSATSRHILMRNDVTVFAACGLFVASLISIPASFHSGSSSNYYFTLAFFMCLTSAAGIVALARSKTTSAGPVCTASIAGWGVFIVAIFFIFSGHTGVSYMKEQHIKRTAQLRCLEKLPKPVFSDDSYYGLPWVMPGNEYFVVSFQYPVERNAGRKFEKNGVGGLISSGKFKALAFLQKPPPKVFDGAPLEDFVYRPDLCAEMSVMISKSN